jgi:acyl dehydratase
LCFEALGGNDKECRAVAFLRPVYPGDTVTACLETTRIDREHELIEMSARIHNQAGEDVIRGQALAMLLRNLQDAPD